MYAKFIIQNQHVFNHCDLCDSEYQSVVFLNKITILVFHCFTVHFSIQ